MICNKKEWETIDELTSVCLKLAQFMTPKQKEVVTNFIYLCSKSTEKEKESREKSALRIKEKRKTNPDYARPARECRKTSKKEVLK